MANEMMSRMMKAIQKNLEGMWKSLSPVFSTLFLISDVSHPSRSLYSHFTKKDIVCGGNKYWTDDKTADLNHEWHPICGLELYQYQQRVCINIGLK
jgi:hypothetical protein